MPDRYLDDRGFVIGTEPDDGLPAHLHPDAVAGCTLCDADGYRGATICDHREHYVETENGRALVHAELAKLRKSKTDRARGVDSFGAQNPARTAAIHIPERTRQSRLPFGCARCDNRWNGYKTAHCGAQGCHRTFTSTSAFDKHHDGSHANDTRHCVDPATVGLVDAGRSYPCWGWPSDDRDWLDALDGGDE